MTLTRVQKNRTYAALIAVAFIAGFIVDSPAQFLLFVGAAMTVVGFVETRPTRQPPRAVRNAVRA